MHAARHLTLQHPLDGALCGCIEQQPLNLRREVSLESDDDLDRVWHVLAGCDMGKHQGTQRAEISATESFVMPKAIPPRWRETARLGGSAGTGGTGTDTLCDPLQGRGRSSGSLGPSFLT